MRSLALGCVCVNLHAASVLDQFRDLVVPKLLSYKICMSGADKFSTTREGDHCDFKREPHANTGDLMKDIFYGVDDTGSVAGFRSYSGRTQSDIMSMSSKVGLRHCSAWLLI